LEIARYELKPQEVILDIEKPFQRFPQIETKRLILREIIHTDDEALFSIFSDGEVMRYYNTEPMKKIIESRGLITRFAEGFKKQAVIRWGITTKADGRLIGTCGFHTWDKESFKAEVGYELAQNYWRHGFMSETLRKVIAFGINNLKLNRIEALVQPRNVASKDVLLKLGFAEVGLLTEHRFFKGKYVDMLILSILSKDFAEGV
jgi:ribosomal-protein-alanine N-acetyltransferase